MGGRTRPRPFGRISYFGLCVGSCFLSFECRRWWYTPATVSRWVSSINQFHSAAGLDAPGRTEVVRRALSGIRRIRATPPVRRSPLLLADIRTLLTTLTQEAGG